MAQKKFDLKEVSRAAAENERQPGVASALGANSGVISYYLRKDEAFRTAYNQGRKKGGFALYQPRGAEASNGGSAATRPKPQLDASAESAFFYIDNAANGISFGDLCLDMKAVDDEVTRALSILTDNKMIESRPTPAGTKYFAVAGDDLEQPRPTPARRTNTPPRKSQATKQRSENGSPQSAGDGAAPVTADLFLETARVARVLEQARVELLYTRAHGEASPKFFDVVEGIERELVKAVASV